MAFSYDKDSWDLVDDFQEAASYEACAAQYSLQQNDLRRALKRARNGIPLFCLSKSKAKSQLEDAVAQFNVHDATMTRVEEVLALDDAANSSLDLLLQVQHARSTKEVEPEQYSPSMTRALHTTFHEAIFLPCSCQHPGRPFRILDEYACALRLDGHWNVSSGESHCVFDSVVRTQLNSDWTHIQFQLPKVINKVSHPDLPDDSDRETRSHPPRELDDFCRLVQWRPRNYGIPIRMEIHMQGSMTHHRAYELAPVPSDISTENCVPMSLLEALQEESQGKSLSARSKIFLAFTLSKSFWQFYESPWMQAEWNFQTIHFFPQLNDSTATLDLQGRIPFLNIDALEPDQPFSREYEPPDWTNKIPHLHRYPYLLNLGFLLVLLCSDDPGMVVTDAKSWPAIDVSIKYKKWYRDIIKHCLPDAIADMGRNVAERREALRDNVVRPLYSLYLGMGDPDADAEGARETEIAGTQTGSGSGTDIDKIEKTPRYVRVSIFTPQLTVYPAIEMRGDEKTKNCHHRYGYDPMSSFIRNPQRNRFNLQDFGKGHERYHWKDFWKGKEEPLDEDGHGTSMLSIIMRIAPFADVCVARIAGFDKDLGDQATHTSQHLAEAIRWAVETHHVDIISMSLGWKKEYTFEGRYVVRNAISYALDQRDQKILFFAAASNFGGGKHELFPAKHPQVFSIRATDTFGVHKNFNAALPDGTEVKVYGTLGVGVPTARKGGTEEEIGRSGTSAATAITAGIAALVISYINTYGEARSWDNIKTQDGFQKLLYSMSTEPEGRKRFITLENLYNHPESFESQLDSARWAS
ncbi:MAG: hypothetical protein M1840_006426 [Geoglossum simile]|nr:MAG: hypothetical protein M1840_006426 [Geoglossum simile]